jgi:hypothetical protein
MNPSGIPVFVTMWLVVNAGALLVLGVLSYVSSVLALAWLASFDKWMYLREHKHELDSGAESPDAPEMPLEACHTVAPVSPSRGGSS